MVSAEYRKSFYREMCKPGKHHVTFCVDYNTETCPQTCNYAVTQIKKCEENT